MTKKLFEIYIFFC